MKCAPPHEASFGLGLVCSPHSAPSTLFRLHTPRLPPAPSLRYYYHHHNHHNVSPNYFLLFLFTAAASVLSPWLVSGLLIFCVVSVLGSFAPCPCPSRHHEPHLRQTTLYLRPLSSDMHIHASITPVGGVRLSTSPPFGLGVTCRALQTCERVFIKLHRAIIIASPN